METDQKKKKKKKKKNSINLKVGNLPANGALFLRQNRLFFTSPLLPLHLPSTILA
jgi:hypothetical protein